jgi:2-keto-4-pentenoate hydratase/2-oxohepta-3-ene-1,7-dioic acid hydratase in catechol pathway
MRFATILDGRRSTVAVLRDDGVLPLALPGDGFGSMRAIAATGAAGLERVRDWVEGQPAGACLAPEDVRFGPAVPDPGAVYTIGRNYVGPGEPEEPEPNRPLVYAKLPTAVTGHGSTVTWDRSLTANVDPEVELGVVIGAGAMAIEPQDAIQHVFGYTCINDMSSRDPWLDGDQWLLGKSMAGFCPVGPWVVTPDEVEPGSLRLGCTINGVAVQEGSTAQMRHSIADLISYLSRHTVLRPGDLIATGTPPRLAGPLGPERHLRAGDVVTVWIEEIGELTTTIA